MKIVSAVGYTLCRVPVDSVVCKSMMSFLVARLCSVSLVLRFLSVSQM